VAPPEQEKVEVLMQSPWPALFLSVVVLVAVSVGFVAGSYRTPAPNPKKCLKSCESLMDDCFNSLRYDAHENGDPLLTPEATNEFALGCLSLASRCTSMCGVDLEEALAEEPTPDLIDDLVGPWRIVGEEP
jgi:hypothetical protein